MSGLEWVLLISIVLALYPLAGYPLVIALIGAVRPRRVRRASHQPTVTVLIPAFNEADCIGRTVQNKLDQDYPADKLQIVVVSDQSDDGTDDIVRGFESRGVKLVRREVRQGKAAGLNEAVKHATGDIIVFSDANAEFAPDAISRMVENFADPEVGYVTGNLSMRVRDGSLAGEGNSGYIKYENWLRIMESTAGSVIGVNGGCDCMRRSLYQDVPADQITDFVLPLRTIVAGKRVIYDPRVRSFEEANEELSKEFRMRVRVALRALRGLWYMRAVLNPFRHPLAALCVVSHKVLRYGTFIFMIGALLANTILALDNVFYAWLLAAQIAVYAIACLGISERAPRVLRKIGGLPSYFLVSNVAFAIATLRFIRGESMATWRPRGG
jgi:cellulose synthase/poly-beta-1,6-N-acetylglucosamine synthase-like glycosyltransferase